jgi:hypothetical protein
MISIHQIIKFIYKCKNTIYDVAWGCVVIRVQHCDGTCGIRLQWKGVGFTSVQSSAEASDLSGGILSSECSTAMELVASDLSGGRGVTAMQHRVGGVCEGLGPQYIRTIGLSAKTSEASGKRGITSEYIRDYLSELCVGQCSFTYSQSLHLSQVDCTVNNLSQARGVWTHQSYRLALQIFRRL